MCVCVCFFFGGGGGLDCVAFKEMLSSVICLFVLVLFIDMHKTIN